jgi:hypothetical protein
MNKKKLCIKTTNLKIFPIDLKRRHIPDPRRQKQPEWNCQEQPVGVQCRHQPLNRLSHSQQLSQHIGGGPQHSRMADEQKSGHKLAKQVAANPRVLHSALRHGSQHDQQRVDQHFDYHDHQCPEHCELTGPNRRPRHFKQHFDEAVYSAKASWSRRSSSRLRDDQTSQSRSLRKLFMSSFARWIARNGTRKYWNTNRLIINNRLN